MSNDSPLVDLIENMLLTPSSDFYISTFLYSKEGADPLFVSNFGEVQQNIDGIDFVISFNNITAKGLSNIQIKFDASGDPEITVVGNQVTFHGKLPNTQDGYKRPDDVPPNLQITGELDVTIGGQVMPKGSFCVTVQTIDDMSGFFTVTEDQAGQLSTARVTFTALSLNPAESTNNISITVNLNTSFAPTINQVLNTPELYGQIIQEINEKINSPSFLGTLSQRATSLVQNIKNI